MSELQNRMKDLTPDQLRALAQRLKGRKGAPPREEPSLPVLVHAPEERFEPFPLTDVQQAYWVGRRGIFELGNVSTHGYSEWPMVDLDLDRITRALRRLIGRHEMLRAVILPDGQNQRILPEVPPYEVAVLDLRGLPEPEVRAKLAAVREELSHQVLPEDRWPLFDIRATLLDEGRAVVHVSFDTLIGDLWSLLRMIDELRQLYLDPEREMPPIDVSFRDYIVAQKAFEKTEAYRRSERYWQERLRDIPPGPELPVDENPAALTHAHFARRFAQLDAPRWRRLRGLAAGYGLTPSGLLLTAYATVLSLWSKSPRFSLNITNFNRLPIHPHVQRVIGDFISLTFLSVDFSQPMSFEQRAQEIQKQLWKNLEHGHISGIKLMRELARLEGRAPRAMMPVVFTSMLIDQQQDAAENDGAGQEQARAAGAAAEDDRPGGAAYGITQTPQVWLDHQVMEDNGRLVFNWDAVAGLFPPGLFDEMFDAYLRLLDRLLDEEGWTRGGRRWLIEHQLRERAWTNETAAPVPQALAQQLFEEQARMRPDAPAVISAGRSLTYGELDRLSNQLAHRLRRMGARPDRLVAVVMEKGWQQVVAVLGILKAGGAYLPVPADLPRDRWWYLLSHGEVSVAITQAHLAAELEWPAGVRRVLVEDAADAPGDPLEAVQGPENLAYVLFTSGSTGLPKGAMIEHRNVVNRMVDVRGRFGIGPEDRAFGITALHHDLSVFDLFGVLGSGGALVLPEPSGVRDPSHWIDCMAREGVTLWNSVPALLEMLAEELEHRRETSRPSQLSLRATFLAGDWIPVSLPDRMRGLVDGLQFFALGGPTETTVWDICYPVGAVDPSWRSIPYGRPMTNTRYHVLSEALEPCPTWVPGELCIAGEGVARGYWRDADKTSAAFIPDPGTGERLYRSGDLGRYLPDGTIEFMGRKDFQVKIQGHRIELGEIESVLAQHPAVRLPVVTVVGAERSRRRLVAYVVPASGISVAAGAVASRAALEAAERELDTWAAPPVPALPPRGEKIKDELAKVEFKLSEPGVRRGGLENGALALGRPAFDERLLEAYRSRSTWRDFSPEPVPLAALGRLLESLLRVRPEGEPLRIARYDSPGGLYPVQVYLHVQAGRVEGAEGGLYYYHPGEHTLVLRAAGVELGAHAHLPVNQAVAERAAFTLLMVGRLGAVAPAHGGRALDLALIEAGSMGQLLMGSAPATGLGLCPLSTFDFGRIAPHLGLEDGDELLHSFLGGLRARPAAAAAGGDSAAPGSQAPAGAETLSEGAFLPPARRDWRVELDASGREALRASEPGLRRISAGDSCIALAPPVSGEARRDASRRELAGRPVPFGSLGRLLSVLLGIKTPEWPLAKYRYPSGGALYPVQVYLAAGPDAVEGLAEGAYYYHPRRHCLIPVRPGPIGGATGLSLFLVGQLDAVQPIYGEWALDFCFLEAGYMSHLLAGNGPRHGIGLTPAEGLDPELLAPLLDLGPGHVVLHALAGGAVAQEDEVDGAEAPGSGEEERTVSAADFEDELKACLRRKLPNHMVPATFVFLEAMPLTANGKINRKALPTPDSERRDDVAPPSSDLERKIAGMLAEVLRIENVGRDQNFFELGGNSIQMVQFYRKLQPVVNVKLTVVDVFNHPTVASLAELLARGGQDEEQILAEAESRAAGKREGRGRLSRQLEKKKQRRGMDEVS